MCPHGRIRSKESGLLRFSLTCGGPCGLPSALVDLAVPTWGPPSGLGVDPGGASGFFARWSVSWTYSWVYIMPCAKRLLTTLARTALNSPRSPINDWGESPGERPSPEPTVPRESGNGTFGAYAPSPQTREWMAIARPLSCRPFPYPLWVWRTVRRWFVPTPHSQALQTTRTTPNIRRRFHAPSLFAIYLSWFRGRPGL